MGAGKTTIGKALAHELKLDFYDLDWYIEDRFRMRIPEIFDKKGENGFREIERNMLHEVAEFENVVISAGGGTPCFFDNVDYMNQQADTVFLKADPEVLYTHLISSKSQRPLIQGKTKEELKSYISDSLVGREPFYSKAKYTVNINIIEHREQIQNYVTEIMDMLNIE